MHAFSSLKQIVFLFHEIGLLINRKIWRCFTVWFSSGVYVLISYRIDRFLFLLLGRAYVVLRPLFWPLFVALGILGGKHEIHYRAEIGKGLRVLHPSLGIVVTAMCIAGDNLILTGGNCIGGRKKGSVVKIGNNVNLGANSSILGPVKIGDNCNIGMGSVVMSNCASNSFLMGVPAREFSLPSSD